MPRSTGRAVVAPMPWRKLLVATLHLSALWGLAVVQPTLELLGDGDNAAIFFAGRRVIGLPFALILTLLVVVPLLALLGLEALAARAGGERWRRRLHLFFLWGLASLLALYALERIARSTAASPNGALLMLLGAAVVGLAFTALYRRGEVLGNVLAVLSPIPLVSLALFLLASPASGLLFAGGSEEPVDAPASATPIVMLILDELPVSTLMDEAGRIDRERFPAFAALAGRSTWYRGEVSAADDTVQAVPSILASARPDRGDQPVHSARPETIFRLLGKSHRVTAMEHATWLCPPETCEDSRSVVGRARGVASALSLAYFDTIVPPGVFKKLGVGVPDIGRSWGEALRSEDPARPADELLRLTKDEPRELARYHDAQFAHFLSLIERHRPGQRPAPFYMLHSSSPHLPWVFLPGGSTYASIREELPARNPGNEQWSSFPLGVAVGWQRHIVQARFSDRLLAGLLATLRRQALFDKALIVVTADHGASFIPGDNRRFVTEANAADVAMVPLFIKAPGQRRAAVRDRTVQSIDILPTIAELLDVNIPWKVEGRSALGPGPGRRSVAISSFQNPVLRTSPRKLVRQRAATLRRQALLFGTGLEGGGGFGLGSARDLVGLRTRDLRVAPAGAATATLANAARFDSVDPSSRFLPVVRAVGRIVGAGARAREVAVAVNGRVAGVGPTAAFANGVRGFSFLLSPDYLRAGRNEVRVYAVRGRGRRALLEPARLTGGG